MSQALSVPQVRLEPHPGPQFRFAQSSADVVIFGGAAGGGKTHGLLLEPLRFVTHNPKFNAICFRRTTTQVRNPGGLWDAACRLYPLIGGHGTMSSLEFKWEGGGKIKFAHLENDMDRYNYQGAELPLICFDEVTQFTEAQFWYLFSRLRSTSGVSGYVRATCNPDVNSWVAKLIAWWINQETGYAIPERSGVIRWFVRIDDMLHWADTREELVRKHQGSLPKSLTFIASTLDDNPTLALYDPEYRTNLMALQAVERERLLNGNWKIRPSAGLYFNRAWVKVVDIVPPTVVTGRGWDLAATPETTSNDPDWTTGTKIGRLMDGTYVVLDHIAFRGTPAEVERSLLNISTQDGHGCIVGLPQDPGQAGKAQIASLVRMLAGFRVEYSTETGDKITRFSPFSAQAEAGTVLVQRGAWNDRWFNMLEGFPEVTHDDDVDSTSRAFQLVAANNLNVWANL